MDKFTVHLDKTQPVFAADRIPDALTWDQLADVLKIAFSVKPYESLISIDVSDKGVAAKIGLINSF